MTTGRETRVRDSQSRLALADASPDGMRTYAGPGELVIRHTRLRAFLGFVGYVLGCLTAFALFGMFILVIVFRAREGSSAASPGQGPNTLATIGMLGVLIVVEAGLVLLLASGIVKSLGEIRFDCSTRTIRVSAFPRRRIIAFDAVRAVHVVIEAPTQSPEITAGQRAAVEVASLALGAATGTVGPVLDWGDSGNRLRVELLLARGRPVTLGWATGRSGRTVALRAGNLAERISGVIDRPVVMGALDARGRYHEI